MVGICALHVLNACGILCQIMEFCELGMEKLRDERVIGREMVGI